jgi:hypothetical protein
VPNCSASTSGAWLDNMTPPDPTRMPSVAEVIALIRAAGALLAIPRHAVVLGDPESGEAQPLGLLG